MADNDVDIVLNVETKDANKSVDNFEKNILGSLKNIEKKTDSLGSSFKSIAVPAAGAFAAVQVAANAVIGVFNKFSQSIEDSVQEAKQLKQIGASLKATGEFSQGAVDGVLEFADAIKSATTLDDDLVKSLFISAKAFGTTNEQAEKLTKSAIDLAAATGVDTETALRQLGGTLDGSIGRIGNLGAEFRNLTEAQLKSGEAIDLVSQKFGGTAASEADSYQGSVNRLSNAFGDLSKAVGGIITQSSALQTALNATASLVNSIAESAKNGFQPESIVKSNLEIARKKIDLLELEGKQTNAVTKSVLELGEASKGLGKSSDGIQTFSERLQSLEANVVKGPGGLTGKALEEEQKRIKKLNDDFASFSKSVAQNYGTNIEKLVAKSQEQLIKLNEFSAQFGEKDIKRQQEIADEKLLIAEALNDDIAKENERARKEELDAIERADAAYQKVVKDAAAEAQDLRDKNAKADAETASTVNSAANFANAAANGKEGARFVVSQGAGALADAFAPGSGQAVASLANTLSQGPEQTKAMVRAFVEALPDIITAIAESIPVVVEAFVDSMVNEGGAARIAVAIAKAFALQPVWASIGKQLGINSGDELRSRIVGGFSDVISKIRNVFQEFISKIVSLPAEIAKAIKKGLGGGSGGGSGLISEGLGRLGNGGGGIGPVLGFARGGMVPAYAADGMYVPRGSDTVPAMLTPGELVVPRDTTTELQKFLATQNQTSDRNMAGAFGQMMNAFNQPVVVNSQVKVNQNAFADIILQLNRQNARLTA